MTGGAEFWSDLRVIRDRWDVLRHPFYVRWSAGELCRDELMLYAEEYDHLVVALAAVSRRAAAKAGGQLGRSLEDHAHEEQAHIDLWRRFARATGWCARGAWHYGSDPYPATVECSRVWAGDASRSLAMDLVTLYSIEAAQPQIAQRKLDGLRGVYGFEEGPATEYFRLHAILDKHHATLAQSALDGLLAGADPLPLLAQAEAAYRSYWSMLDAVEGAKDR